MRKCLFFILPLFILGCEPKEKVSIEHSPVLYEEAVVSDLVFTPPSHFTQTVTEMKFGPYFDFWRGEFRVGFHPVQVPKTTKISPKYGILFECQHGKFYVEREQLYNTLHRGDKVKIEYREKYKITCEKFENEWVETKRELVKLDFLQAYPANMKLEKE